MKKYYQEHPEKYEALKDAVNKRNKRLREKHDA